MPEVDEETLINAVNKVRIAGAVTNAEVAAALAGEGIDTPMGAVKKAASKATKRFGLPAAVPAAPTAAAAEAEAPTGGAEEAPKPAAPLSAKAAKKAAQKEKGAAAELKAQENAMMEAQRKLRTAKSGGGLGQAVHIDGTMEHFIQQITTRAISGVLEKGDEICLKERMDADIAAIEWVKLASAAGALSVKEDVIALGGELQLARLKEIRAAKWDFNAAMACYTRPEGGEGEGYQGVDRMVAASRKSDGAALEADEQD